jgi:hypothetical protein
MSALPPKATVYCAAAESRDVQSAGHHAVRLDQHYVALREDERPLVRDLIEALTILTDFCQKGSCVR